MGFWQAGIETTSQPGLLHRDPECVAGDHIIPVYNGTAYRIIPHRRIESFTPIWHHCRPDIDLTNPHIHWRDHARCADTNDFCDWNHQRCISFCVECPVASSCLRFVMKFPTHNYFDAFVYAGLNPNGRDRLAKLIKR